MPDQPLLITVDAAEASDNWGFVGVVRVGYDEAYRTIRAYSTPLEARAAAQALLAGVLGSLMAGQEWRTTAEELGHTPRRSDLGLGLGFATAQRRAESAAEEDRPPPDRPETD